MESRMTIFRGWDGMEEMVVCDFLNALTDYRDWN